MKLTRLFTAPIRIVLKEIIDMINRMTNAHWPHSEKSQSWVLLNQLILISIFRIFELITYMLHLSFILI